MLPDFGWTELLVISVVLIVVIGPKDLPRVLRGFGKTMTSVRPSSVFNPQKCRSPLMMPCNPKAGSFRSSRARSLRKPNSPCP